MAQRDLRGQNATYPLDFVLFDDMYLPRSPIQPAINSRVLTSIHLLGLWLVIVQPLG